MKNNTQSLTCMLAITTLIALPTRALIVGPYTPDANTVQLWSFDEAAGSSSISNDVGTGKDLVTADIGDQSHTPITSLTGGSGFSGYGNAIDLTAGGASAGVIHGPSQNAKLTPADLGIDDAFTLEAMVNMSSITSGQQEIISMEDDANNRVFQFVISSGGNLDFTPINGPSVTNGSFAIPNSGEADAFAADEWFHVAVTYNGNGGVADNLNFYWTRVDGSRTEANLIGSGTLSGDLANNSRFVIGNEGRDAGNEKLGGLIDEVRLSDVARGEDEMIFAIPEPSTLVLASLAAIAGAVALRRRKS